MDDAVVISPFCERHRHDLIVQRLQRGPNDTWLVYEVTAMLLLFQWAAAAPASPAGKQELTRDERQQALREYAGKLGCLACWDVAAYDRAARLIRKGLSHAVDVANMKAEDQDWPRTPADLPHAQ